MESCERKPAGAHFHASPQEFQDGVACKDVFLTQNEAEGEGECLWARIYLPQTPTGSINLDPQINVIGNHTLPVIFYFHGGGFIVCSVAESPFHPLQCRLAKATCSIVVAVEYRLAPEHRLPAAYDDCLASVTWLQSQASLHNTDPWLHAYADFSQCYLVGDSAGANIVYNLSLKLADMKVDPLHIRGHVLIHPFFGGITSTRTEDDMVNDDVLPLSSTRWAWEQALPEGADRDHPFSNPTSIPSSVYKNAHLPKTLVAIAHGDPMKERQMQYYSILKEAGVDVHVHFQDGKHGFYLDGSEKAAFFINHLTSFLHEC